MWVKADSDCMVGRTVFYIRQFDGQTVEFVFSNGDRVHLRHEQECCEVVEVDICGIPSVPADVLAVREESRGANVDGSLLWTFFDVEFEGWGSTVICFKGQSNGHYSVGADWYQWEEPR